MLIGGSLFAMMSMRRRGAPGGMGGMGCGGHGHSQSHDDDYDRSPHDDRIDHIGSGPETDDLDRHDESGQSSRRRGC